MPDEFYHNGLADPPAGAAGSGPSMLDQAQGAVRNWWNGLGDDMRNQAGLPQSELLRRFGLSALTLGPMGVASRGGAGIGRDAVMAHRFDPKRLGHATDDVDGPRAETLSNFAPKAMRTPETFVDSNDPVFIGARTGDFYRGPDAPANMNTVRQPELANPSAGRMSQALDNDGSPPRVQLNADDAMVRHYLELLNGRPRGANVIEGPWGDLEPPR